MSDHQEITKPASLSMEEEEAYKLLNINPINPTIPSAEEAYKQLNLIPNPNGSVTRINHFPNVLATPDLDPSSTTPQIALSKDIPLNSETKTFLRLFRPVNIPNNTKLPIIIEFHGGGFVLMSATSIIFHESCSKMTRNTPAIVASLEYRLAPEHRLPAAYDDAMDAIMWVKKQGLGGDDVDPWMREFADYSRTFMMGSSAGGNMVYNAALRAVDLDLSPVKIVGLIINQPFFGGVARTESMLKYIDDRIVPIHVSDLLWSLCLPDGADRGHEYCDPSCVSGSYYDKIGRLPVSVVRGYAGDPLVDSQKEFAKMLEARGVRVIKQFFDKGHHGVEIFDPTFAQLLYNDVRDFVCSIGGEKVD